MTHNQSRNFKEIILTVFYTLLILMTVSTSAQQSFQYYDQNIYDPIPTYTEEDIQTRLKSMDLCITPEYSSVVKSYVKTYMVTGRQKARSIIGRTVMYFPIFEKYLKDFGLPSELKCVSVLESALDPHAKSRSKATGLWQFMAPTGREYGLQINSTVDERSDPHRSTKAALTYLRKLHDRYGDWSLALAAYNSGPGTVNRAIKRARSKRFSRVAKYLPRETRNYIPAFFAAAYLVHYYHEHGIEGNYPDLDMQITDMVTVYNRVTFEDIANVTGLSKYTVRDLNPSYKKGIIPASQRGNYVILPERVMGSFIQFLKYPDSRNGMVYSSESINVYKDPNDHFFKTKYKVLPTDNLQSLANLFRCNAYSIMAWNNLKTDVLYPGQELVMYQPFVSSQYKSEFLAPAITTREPSALKVTTVPKRKKYSTNSIASIPLSKINVDVLSEKPTRTLKSLSEEHYVFYRVVRGESLVQIAAKFPGVTLEDILTLNDLGNRKRSVKPGSRIKIKRL